MKLVKAKIVSLSALLIPSFLLAAAEEALIQLEPVTVTTGTRTERTLDLVPVRTELVWREDIDLRGSSDFSQAIELLNGVRVESNCQNCNTSEVQLLGLPGGYNQILFDGAPLLSVLGGVYGLEQIPAAFVDRIEVVKGGGSALYGPGAVGGVINLIPARPYQNGGYTAAGVEGQKGTPIKSADARFNLVADKAPLAVSLVFQVAENAPIDFDGDGFSEITKKERAVGGFQLWWEPGERTRVTANYQFTRESRRGGNRFDQSAWLANVAEALDTDFHRGGVAVTQTVGSDLEVRAAYGFALITRESFYGGLGDVVTDPGAAGYDPDELDPTVPGSAASTAFNQYGFTRNPLHFFETQVSGERGAHTLTVGAQYQRESVWDENRDFDGNRNAGLLDETFSNFGIFAQDEWAVGHELDLVLGVRWDKSSVLDDGIFSPRVAVRYAPRANLTLRGGVAAGFRAPEIFSEDLHVDTLGAEPVGIRNDPGLTEERSLTSSLGAEWRPVAFDGNLVVEVTASFTRIRDTFGFTDVQTDPMTGALFQTRENTEGSVVAGLEFNAAWRPASHFRVEAGIAAYRSRFDEVQVVFDDTDEGGGTVIATRRYLKTPDLTGTAQVVWSPNEAWDVFTGVKVTGPMRVLNQSNGLLNRTSVFTVVDAGVMRHFEWGRHHLDLSIGVRNLFDQRQGDLETGPDRDSDYVYGPRFARSFYVRGVYHF